MVFCIELHKFLLSILTYNIFRDIMTDKGFQKATSNNLPKIDVGMVAEFFRRNVNFGGAEMRGVIAVRSARESYGDSAIGYVQVRCLNPNCTVKAKISPEHKVRSKSYAVTLVVNEAKELIETVACHDCSASAGGCKHAVAFLMWVHRRSEDPAPTEISCYWQKAKLSRVGTTLKFVKAADFSESATAPYPVDGSFLETFVNLSLIRKNNESLIMKHFIPPSGPESLSIYQLMVRYHGDQNVDAFIDHCSTEMPTSLCELAARDSENQADCKLWYELRHGRITASKLYEAANCKKMDGVLVELILGARHISTPAMERGRMLEGTVLLAVSKKINTSIKKAGILLNGAYPIFGASPDGIIDSAVVEIKCPSTIKTFGTYIKNGKINKKYLAQMNLQMLFAEKKKALFCVAHPDFIESNKVEIVEVDMDITFLESVMAKAQTFWKNAVFPTLMKSVSLT